MVLLMRYTIILEEAAEGGYTVTCPALPGLVTEGDTYEDALAMAKDAIDIYLSSLKADGIAFPTDVAVFAAPVESTYAISA